MVNRQHPDYPAYQKKFNDLWNEYQQKFEMVTPSGPKMLDNPGLDSVRDYPRKIKLLQEEYKHLFY